MPDDSTLHARCDTCDNYRMFRLGLVQSAEDLYAIWDYINTLHHTPCDCCGAMRWAVSIRLGTVVIPRDTVVAISLALPSNALLN